MIKQKKESANLSHFKVSRVSIRKKGKKKKMKKGEESLRDLRNAGKGINKYIMGIPE